MFSKLVATILVLALPIGSVKVSVSPRGMVRKVARHQGGTEQDSSLSSELDQKCRKQHPAHLADVASMTSKEILECYSKFHDATLAAWRAEQPEKCEGRYARVFRADHGLGDSGGNFVFKFQEAIMHGDMMFWLFPTEGFAAGRTSVLKSQTVWQAAMKEPFDWNLNNNKHLFCLENDTVLDDLMSNKKNTHIVGKCPTCKDPRTNTALTALQHARPSATSQDVFKDKAKETWEFLYRPTDDVQQVIQEVLGQVQSGERLVGVHFRAQWFGDHFACGCMDTRETPQCMTNIGHVMQQRNISGFENNPRLKYFVASDETAGVDAFREAYGRDVLTLPDTLPLEHSLFASAAGAKRLLAEFVILSKASAILGSCGSTFTERLILLSGLQKEATIITGTQEARACAGLKRPTHDLKAFHFSRFTKRAWTTACYCYGDESNGGDRGGTCDHACKGDHRPSLCKNGPKSLMQSEVPTKPEWVPQKWE